MEIIQLVLSVELRNEIYESCVLKRTNKSRRTTLPLISFMPACNLADVLTRHAELYTCRICQASLRLHSKIVPYGGKVQAA